MPGVVACFVAALRRRWRAWVALGLLLGVVGGVVMSLAVGARRTESAYRRFIEVSAPSDVLVLDSNDYGFTGRVDLEAVASRPQVATVARVTSLFFPAGEADGRPISFADLLPMISADGRLGTEVDRQRILEGRPADPGRADEAVIGFTAAEELGIGVGSRIDMLLLDEDDFGPLVVDFLTKVRPRLAGEDRSSALDELQTAVGDRFPYRVEIVGVEAAPGEFPPEPGDSPTILHLTPAFGEAYADGLVHQDALYVRLRTGASLVEFKAAAERVAGGVSIPFLYTRADQQPNVERSFELQSVVLWTLAALMGISAGIVLAQLLARQSLAEAGDNSALAAIGLTRTQRTGVAAGRAMVEASTAAAVAIVVGWAASGGWSFGLARVAEIDPGPNLDGGVLLPGAAIIASFVVGVVVFSSWRAARIAPVAASSRHLGRVPHLIGSPPLPVAIGMGIQDAISPGHGRRALPVRSVVLALVAAVAVMCAALTFAASLDRLAAYPEAYGWNWHARIGTVGIPDISDDAIAGLRANDGISDVSSGTITQLDVNGDRVGAYAFAPALGIIEPALLEGRAARRRDEIVLGALTMDSSGVALGDDVAVRIGARQEQMRVVGRAVFPDIGDRGQLGSGAWITFGALRRLVAHPVENVLLVRVDPGRDRDATLESLHHALDPFPVVEPSLPEDLVTLGRADQVQRVAMLILGGLAAATLLHALLTARRRRGQEIGTLRAVGFSRWQVVSLFVGQSVALVLVALALGLLVGVGGGRLAWTVVGRQLGFPADPAIPVTMLAGVGLGLLVGAVLVAIGPGIAAAQGRVAAFLRSE